MHVLLVSNVVAQAFSTTTAARKMPVKVDDAVSVVVPLRVSVIGLAAVPSLVREYRTQV